MFKLLLIILKSINSAKWLEIIIEMQCNAFFVFISSRMFSNLEVHRKCYKIYEILQNVIFFLKS